MLPADGHYRTAPPMVVLDVETTGLYPATGDEIVELAAEKLVNGDVVAAFHAYLRPTVPVPPEVVAIHGLDEAFLARHGRAAAEIFPAFAAFIEDAVLVGHNIRRFDLPFLMAHFSRLILSWPGNDVLDTLELARARLDLPDYKLSTVAAHLAIPTAGAHRAAADVAITREVLRRLLADHGRDLGELRRAR
jgi:DNA polymerase III epsilon subunit family exonuclease